MAKEAELVLEKVQESLQESPSQSFNLNPFRDIMKHPSECMRMHSLES